MRRRHGYLVLVSAALAAGYAGYASLWPQPAEPPGSAPGAGVAAPARSFQGTVDQRAPVTPDDSAGGGDSLLSLADERHTLSDLATATFNPRAITRARYTTVSDRCELGLAGASMRCTADSGRATSMRGAQSTDSVEGLKISGRVITTDGYGVPDVTLIASPIGRSGAEGESDNTAVEASHYTRYRAVSAPDGTYVFGDLPAGDYAIRSNRHDRYASRRITVRAGVEYGDLVLEEERRVAIEGRVTDEQGLALSRVSITPVVVGAPSVRSDGSGHYRLPLSLAPAASNVTVRFEAPGFLEANRTVALAAHDAVLAPDGVAAVGLDVTLQSIEMTTNVRGVVTDADGDPIAGRTVVLDASGEQRRYQAVTDRHGEYKLDVVNAPMNYRLSVDGAPAYADYQSEVRVTRFDYVFDVVMEPYRFGSLRGQILDRDGAPVPDRELALRNTASSKPNAIVRSDSTGHFAVGKIPAGETVLASQSMPAILVRGVHVAAGSEANVDVIVDWGSHELVGTVVDRHGRAVPASRVLLRWSYHADGIETSITRRTAADSQGSFKFDQLGSGPYSLVVDAPGFATTEVDHDIGRDGYAVTVRLN
jgi:protocatechuate 3,4-dioxygenase beta subunit